MSSKRAQKAKKRAKREARRQTRREQNTTSTSTNAPPRQTRRKRRAPSTKLASSARIVESLLETASTPPPPITCPHPNATTDSQASATLVAPAYIVKAEECCWNCLSTSAVFALAAEGIKELPPSSRRSNEFKLMSSITWLSSDLQQILTRYSDSSFFLDESPMDGSSNYMNHCSNCGALLEDTDMFCEPGGAFFPMDEEECQRITLIRLPDEIDLRISGQSWFTTFDWQTYARRQ